MTEDIFTKFSKFIWLKLEFKIKSYKRKQKRIKRKEKKESTEPAQPTSAAEQGRPAPASPLFLHGPWRQPTRAHVESCDKIK